MFKIRRKITIAISEAHALVLVSLLVVISAATARAKNLSRSTTESGPRLEEALAWSTWGVPSPWSVAGFVPKEDASWTKEKLELYARGLATVLVGHDTTLRSQGLTIERREWGARCIKITLGNGAVSNGWRFCVEMCPALRIKSENTPAAVETEHFKPSEFYRAWWGSVDKEHVILQALQICHLVFGVSPAETVEMQRDSVRDGWTVKIFSGRMPRGVVTIVIGCMGQFEELVSTVSE